MTGSMIGTVFNNRYQITERIGIGGMAEVYRAQDTVLGRTVAIKVMLPQYAADPSFAKRFKQEAASAANLQSPYIVNIYDWGQDDGTYYIVMEYVRGSDLKTGIQERGAINQRKVAEIGSQVCRALSVAHQQDIIHRDIKPQNIMVQPDGNVKVMDFGIARAKNSVSTQTSSVLGTAHYISPEQAQGKELTAASDIYSLGVVLYEAATGTLPFDGPDAVSVALKQVNELPVPPREVNPSIDPALEAIIMKAMEKDPRNRFATANEMRIELNNFLSGRPVGIAPEYGAAFGSSETAIMSGQRNRAASRQPVVDGTAVMPIAGAGRASGSEGVRPVNPQSYRQSTEPDRGRSSKRGLVIAIVAVIAVIAVAAGIFFFMNNNESGDPVPNVVGMTEDQAKSTLEAAGFKASVERVEDDEVEEGKVIRQDPRGDTHRETGSTVTITVSMGVGQTEVPNLDNLTGSQARDAITRAGLTPVAGDGKYSTDYEANHVMEQSPAAGTVVEKGTEVTYILSMGAENISIPDVTWYSEENATATLRSAGFEVSVTREHSDTVDAGLVIRYSPTGNLEAGKTVTIVVSEGPESTLVSVPNVVGNTYATAESTLRNAGFTVQRSGGSSDSNAVVIWQSITGEAEPGSLIYLETEAAQTGGGDGSQTG